MSEENRMGSKITTLRESMGLSPEELAERADCDVTVILDLENGELAPSLAPLIKITRALGCRLGTLLDDDNAIGPVITRAGDAEQTARFKNRSSSTGGELEFYALAADKTSRHMEPFIIDVTPPDAAADAALSSHEGEEFIYVLDGAIEIEYGKDKMVLEPGDSVYYDSIVPHEVRAFAGPAKILAVVYSPV